MAIKYIKFDVASDLARVSTLVDCVFRENLFRVKWIDSKTAIAESGSKLGYFFLGVRKQYFRFLIQIKEGPSGEFEVLIERETQGWWGGLGTWVWTRTTMEYLRTDLELAFSNAGILLRGSVS